jgi:hypothetical protein
MNTPREAGPQPLSIAVRQDVTQRVSRSSIGGGVVRYLFDPSHDSKASAEPGQDFLALHHTSGKTVFAVCDGVGASFLGHLAAQFLGVQLVEWLWKSPAFESDAEFQYQLARFLNGLVSPARQSVERYRLSASLPPLVRTVLEEKRAYGSEAMFVCGQLQWPSAHEAGSLALACLGDAEIQVLERSHRSTLLTGRQEDRWSTHRGARGTVKTITRPARDLVRLIAYSDGLRTLAADLPRLADDALDREMVRLGSNPLSDDLSLIDLALDERDMPPAHDTSAAARHGHPVRDAPQGVHPQAPRFLMPSGSYVYPGDRLTWTAVPGARSYRVEQATSAAFDPSEVLFEDVPEPWLHLGASEPGPYCYRVRAQLASDTTGWSEPLRVTLRR